MTVAETFQAHHETHALKPRFPLSDEEFRLIRWLEQRRFSKGTFEKDFARSMVALIASQVFRLGDGRFVTRRPTLSITHAQREWLWELAYRHRERSLDPDLAARAYARHQDFEFRRRVRRLRDLSQKGE